MNNIIRASLYGLCLTMTLGTTTPAWAIIWGEVDTENQYPYVGAIVGMESPETGQPFVFCSGTLIHSRVLLTAGHCTDALESYLAQGLITLDDVRVCFGQNALDPKTWLEVQEVITHPHFQPGLVPNNDPFDVGVLILKKPIRKIAPAILPEAGLLDLLKATGELREGSEGGSRLTVVGYGQTLSFPPPEIITPDGLRRFADSEYLGLLDAWIVTSRNQAADDGGSASGDSGGPTLWTDPVTGLDILVGITSWGDPEKVAMTFKYRVDIPQSLDFIDFVIEAAEEGLL
jgi:secreted trypsin-like serine protease